MQKRVLAGVVLLAVLLALIFAFYPGNSQEITLKELIREHVELTGSPRGKEILDNFSEFLPKFKKVLPYDYDRMLRVIASVEERGLDGEQAQIEAFYTVQKNK